MSEFVPKLVDYNPEHSAEIYLPATEEQFRAFVKALVKEYSLPDEDHASAVVANRIQHLPPDQATTTMKYMGHCVLKNVAYQVAQAQGHKIQHKIQVDQLISVLKASPGDQQALDALQKAVNEGSEYAKEALLSLKPSDNIVCMVKPAATLGGDPSSAPISSEPA